MQYEHTLTVLAASLDNMASWYLTTPNTTGFAVTGWDATAIAHADIAAAVRHALKGEYWHAPNDWRSYAPNS